MTPIYQDRFGVPGGNCMQACVASILSLPLSDVPDFCNGNPHENWLNRLFYWTRERRVYPVLIENLDKPISAPIEGLCILGVQTDPPCSTEHPEWLHAVVARNEFDDETGQMRWTVVHDPNPNPRKIVKATDMLFLVRLTGDAKDPAVYDNSTPESRCPSCKVLWHQHPGVAKLCAENMDLRAENERLRQELEEPDRMDRLENGLHRVGWWELRMSNSSGKPRYIFTTKCGDIYFSASRNHIQDAINATCEKAAKAAGKGKP